MPAKRFTVRDTLVAQDTRLIPKGDMRRRFRYQVVDTQAVGDQVYDELSTKRTADATARDLNNGAYGPLAAGSKES